MWKYKHFVANEEHKKQLENQEKWRQKQLDIFYRTGKPIFTMQLDTMHLRKHNNPLFFAEKVELAKFIQFNSTESPSTRFGLPPFR
jgi:hypothetical protein